MIVAVHFIFANFFNGKEGAEDNNARGYYKVGKKMSGPTLDRIR
jgi:hypothetical protein